MPSRHVFLAAVSCAASLFAANAAIAADNAAAPTAGSAAPVAGPSVPPPKSPTGDDPIVLNPFEVATNSDVGYAARDTLSGTRLSTALKDVASQVQVMTPEFLKDLAITDLNDAINYSLNVESASQFFDVSATNVAGNDGSIQAFSGSPRSRGLGGAIIGRDFFQTITPIDTYNTERFTFAPGANNTLFGNASPAGSIDSTTKRARLQKPAYSMEYRVDDRGSQRAVWDVNQPIIKNIFGVRYVGLRERTNEFREPSFRDQNRSFLAATFTPAPQFSLRAWYEHYDSHAQPVRNTLLRDRVTPWIAAGRPAFDNSVTLVGINPTPAAPWIRTPAGRTNPIYVMDPNGGVGLIRLINPASTNFGLVQTVGQAALGTAPNNFDRSLIDESIVPLDTAFAGNAVQNQQRARNSGFVINASPFKNFFIELGRSEEIFKHRFVDLYRFSELNLFADVNRWAVDQSGALRRNAAGALVPNPYFGRYYMEDIFAAAGLTLQRLEQRRASVAYQLDFTKNKGRSKWLGHYNLTGLYDRLIQDQTGPGQRFDPLLFTDAPGGPAGTARTLFYRYYLPDTQQPGSHAVNLPFDPMQAGLIPLPNAGGFQVTGYDSPAGAGAATFPTRRIVYSRAFAAQGFLLQDRIVLGYSWRRDDVKSATVSSVTNATYPRTAGGGFEYLDKAYDSLLRSADYTADPLGEKTKANRSVVVHPFRWLSGHYAELANGSVTGLIRHNLDGTDVELGTGKGTEYGFTLSLFDNRLSIRVNKYVSTLVGVQNSPLAAANNVALAVNGGGGNQIRDDIAAIEQAALRNGAPLSQKYAGWNQALLSYAFAPNLQPGSQPATAREDYDFIVDRESRGYEITIVGNPTPQWRVSVSASQNESQENNLAPQYFDLIRERLPIWAQHLNAPTYRSADQPRPLPATAQTLGQLLQASIGNFYFIQRAAGQPNVADRKYRVTVTNRYGFREGWAKGSFVGANYVWRSPAAVGFNPITVTDNPFVVPGLTATALTVSDPLNPIRGGSLMSFDVFAGYGRRFYRNKLRWDIQLNVRNALNRDGLLVQRALTTGEPAVFTIQEPRTLILTNTISF
jgi:outer membrane receptor protein involved in Fe transport